VLSRMREMALRSPGCLATAAVLAEVDRQTGADVRGAGHGSLRGASALPWSFTSGRSPSRASVAHVQVTPLLGRPEPRIVLRACWVALQAAPPPAAVLAVARVMYRLSSAGVNDGLFREEQLLGHLAASLLREPSLPRRAPLWCG